MPVLEEDYLHRFASERFALASAIERLSERSEFARMADNRRANRNSKRNESDSSTVHAFSAKIKPGLLHV